VLTQLAFDLADRWRNPVQIYGDYLLAHTSEAVEIEPIVSAPLPGKEWAVDGSLGGTGRARNVNPLGMTKGVKGIDPEPFWKRLQAKHDAMARDEARSEQEFTDDADVLVVAFGTRRVAVLEQNAGQMIDDVRLAVLGEAPVVPIGGISSDAAGFGIGPLLDTRRVRERVECALEGREVEP
jgi:2-oxoglutarate ferredoxin oxidoreductase subunit alpha